MVYFSDNVTLKLCQEEEHCGSFLWTNVDDMNRTSKKICKRRKFGENLAYELDGRCTCVITQEQKYIKSNGLLVRDAIRRECIS